MDKIDLFCHNVEQVQIVSIQVPATNVSEVEKNSEYTVSLAKKCRKNLGGSGTLGSAGDINASCGMMGGMPLWALERRRAMHITQTPELFPVFHANSGDSRGISGTLRRHAT